MKLILLSGNSVNTREWIEFVERELKDLFDLTYIQYYKHWETGNENIDFDYELNKLSNSLKDKKDYVIFGKSAGVALALKGISEGKLSPKKCMLTGIPVFWCDSINAPIRKWIKNYKTPSYFIQKTKDPAINARDLKSLLEKNKVKNSKFIEIPGEDHHYEDLEELKRLMKELII